MPANEFENEWKETWNARENALKSVLGDTDGRVYHAMIPFHLGGQADVLCFPNHIPGRVYATCELIGEPSQKRNSLGTFELMIAHRDADTWGATVLARLAAYTCKAQLKVLDTMEIGPAGREGSTIVGFIFVEYRRFRFRDNSAGVLLCIGITADELAACCKGRGEEVFAALKAHGIYPYTDLFRKSVF